MTVAEPSGSLISDPQVIPVGAEPVKGLFWGADLSFRFLRQVLGAPSYGVGVRDRPKADRGAAGGP
jgi:hypothetical protein